MTDPTDRSVAAVLADCRDELVATEELPVAPAASPWLGEAAAVAAVATDAASEGASEKTVRERVSQVRRLLEDVDETGNPTADEHVREARRLAAAAAEMLDE